MSKRKSGTSTEYRVAMIGQKRIPSREGGVEVVVNELATRMVNKGIYVAAYNRSGYHVSGKKFADKPGRYTDGIRIIVVPTFASSKLNAIVYSFLASLHVLFGRYDVIHYHAEGPCAMLWIPKLFGIRVVATIHGLDWQRVKWGRIASSVIKFGEKMAAKYADEIIVLSKNVQAYFKEEYRRETVYVPNGIEPMEKKEVREIAGRFGLEKDGYILFMARIVPEKGLHYLIEAFKNIKTDKKLVIAGGSSHSFEYVEKIKKMAKEDSRVVMTDFIHGRTLEELYSNAYLYVLPSDVEGMAISLLEAMSYENCCVVSDIPENTEVVEDKGILFERGDVADLQNKLEMLLHNKDVVQRYREQSRDFICGKYNWDRVIEETLRIYGLE